MKINAKEKKNRERNENKNTAIMHFHSSAPDTHTYVVDTRKSFR